MLAWAATEIVKDRNERIQRTRRKNELPRDARNTGVHDGGSGHDSGVGE